MRRKKGLDAQGPKVVLGAQVHLCERACQAAPMKSVGEGGKEASNGETMALLLVYPLARGGVGGPRPSWGVRGPRPSWQTGDIKLHAHLVISLTWCRPTDAANDVALENIYCMLHINKMGSIKYEPNMWCMLIYLAFPCFSPPVSP